MCKAIYFPKIVEELSKQDVKRSRIFHHDNENAYIAFQATNYLRHKKYLMKYYPYLLDLVPDNDFSIQFIKNKKSRQVLNWSIEGKL